MDEKYVTVNGYKIRYLEAGNSDKNLVLLHGLGGSLERWAFAIPSLEKKYRVIAPDLIGYGQSDKPQIAYTIDLFTRFVFDFLDTLGIKHCCMVGSSLGGRIVVECASTNDGSIEKIVLVSPAGTIRSPNRALDAYTDAVLNPSFESVKKILQLMMGKNNYIPNKIIEDFVLQVSEPDSKRVFQSTVLGLKNAPSITKSLQRINVPSLVIWGSDDKIIPIENSTEFRNIKNSRFVTMKNCGHVPYEENPDEFSKLILDFLQ